MTQPNYDLMRDIETRYRSASGLTSRDHYSIFYGPLNRSGLLVMNANPGGTPKKYTIVDVYAGKHEYIEGRDSGKTTKNGAEMMEAILKSDREEDMRRIQFLNRFFRRSPQSPAHSLQEDYMKEAKPFLAELINYIQPDIMLFGGSSGVDLFAKAHSADWKAIGEPTMGKNGANKAVYLQEYQIKLPYYRSIAAFSIYHPSKMNSEFRAKVLPVLVEKLHVAAKRDA